jgi:hypothetical protein
VSICGFNDLGFIGLPYTWDNRQDDDHNIKVKLDRVLATDSFLSIFRDVKVWHVQTTTSDHCALVVECLEHSLNRRRKRNFRYENMWQRDPSYMALIRDAWTPHSGAVGLEAMHTRLRGVQHTLSNWDQNVFGSEDSRWAQDRREMKSGLCRAFLRCSRERRSWSGRDQGWTGYGMAITTQPCSRLSHGRGPNVTGSVHFGVLME